MGRAPSSRWSDFRLGSASDGRRQSRAVGSSAILRAAGGYLVSPTGWRRDRSRGPLLRSSTHALRVPVTVVVESDDGHPVIDLPARPKDTVIWVARRGERGGGALVDAVRKLDIEASGVYAYGAAESREITAVRKLLRSEREIPGVRVQMVGYWRRAVAGD
ncbi:MAG: SIP domain-containing protein [Acidimicrobiales bacterium]